jgi:enediyne biosynthesis protein CalE5
LDNATGIGEPAITAVIRVGNSRFVLATDVSPQMLSIAKERAKSRNLDNRMEFRECDAETIALQPSTFDSEFCRWGLMFLPNIETGALQYL